MGSARSSEDRRLIHLPGFSLTSYRENREEWYKKTQISMLKEYVTIVCEFYKKGVLVYVNTQQSSHVQK